MGKALTGKVTERIISPGNKIEPWDILTIPTVKILPIPSVNIRIKGEVVGTMTNSLGEYSMIVTQATAETGLIFQATGYVTQEVLIGNKTVINVTMVKKNLY